LRERLALLGEALAPDQAAALVAYHDLLAASNARYSLVSPADEARIASRHFVESAGFLRWIPGGTIRVLDFGTGGGLPGIVIRILRPESTLVLLEARERKRVFLRHAARTLALSNVLIAGAIGDLSGEEGAPFARVVARSVGPLEEIVTACAPHLAADGLLLVAKGSRAHEEAERARPLLGPLGLRWAEHRIDPLTTRAGERIGLSTLVLGRVEGR
jgi:16S rRNA (guanine527-N7)-methyltransferase